jgi:UPF0755 protein
MNKNNRNSKKRRKKKQRSNITSKYKKYIYSSLALIGIFFTYIIYYANMNIATHNDAKIKSGGIKVIIDDLKIQGYDVGTIDKYLLYVIGEPKIGIIDFKGKTTINRMDFLRQITELSSTHQQEKIMLIPGETLEIFFENVATKLSLNSEKLMIEYKKLSPYPEAGIKPDTYFVSTGMSEEDVIGLMVNLTEKDYAKMAIEKTGSYDKVKWQRILTIASIIQKESANIKEMPVVASVIYNRLDKNMRLQMDGTLNYGKYSHVAVTAERIRGDDSSFNTYKNNGLPISPIGSVEQEAIEAALNPAKTDYLYFVKNSSGVHTFTSNFDDHKGAIKKGRD